MESFARALLRLPEAATSLGSALVLEALTPGRGRERPAVAAAGGGSFPALLEQGLHLGRGSLAALRAALPVPGAFLAFDELENKLEVFAVYRFPERALAGTTASGSLAARLARVATLEPFARLWITEGLGYAHAEARQEIGPGTPPLLAPERIGPVAGERLLALHTGLGLSLARRLLPLGAADDEALKGKLATFRALCERQARPGFRRALFEALGLVVATLEPACLERVDRCLRSGAGEAPEEGALFWHGVGRGLYFAPSLAPPGLGRLALARARRAAHHELGRLGAIAGLAWAQVLVNLRHPGVPASLLGAVAALDSGEREAFSHGAASAVKVAADALGSDPLLLDFLAYGERELAGRGAERWRRWVERPATALLEASGCGPIDEIFRYLPAGGPEGSLGEGRTRC